MNYLVDISREASLKGKCNDIGMSLTDVEPKIENGNDLVIYFVIFACL